MRLVLAVFFFSFLTACDNTATEQVFQIHGRTMGTTYHISWVGQDAKLATNLQQQVDKRLAAINKSMSTYDPESELSLINRSKATTDEQGWITLSADLTEVLAMSLELWQKSDGAFDITVGPLVNLWGFGPDARPEHTPEQASIVELKQKIGIQHLELDPVQRKLRLTSPQYLDLSGVAKGWAVDEIAHLVANVASQSFMVEIGGEIRAQGLKPNKQPWRIAIEKPEQLLQQSSALIIELNGIGVATSGDYRNYFEEQGVRYSHTIDPSTGYPIKHNLASVTVIHPSTGFADAWATALTVSGPEKGLQLAEQYNLAVYMQIGQGNGFIERYSSAFKTQFPQVGGN